MSHKRHRQPLEIMSTMNVTNLLDTAFILLITFMLVTPQLTHGLKINPPRVKDAPQLDIDPGKTLQIVIKQRAEAEPEALYIQDKNLRRVTLDEIYEEVTAAYARFPDLSVVIHVDKDSRVEMTLQTIAAVQRTGISNIGVVTVLPEETAPSSGRTL